MIVPVKIYLTGPRPAAAYTAGMAAATSRSRQTHAFTLIELLVCVSIIALLIALLLPALAEAKAASNSGLCKANLHGLSSSAAMYEADWGILMPLSDSGTGQTWSGPDQKGFIYPYLNNPVQLDTRRRNKIWICPSMVHDPNVVSQERDYGMNSFSYNSTSTSQPRLKLVDIRNPEGTMQWADIGWAKSTTATSLTTSDGMDYVSLDNMAFARTTGPFHGRHSGKGNVVWYDGHVDEQTPLIPTDVTNGLGDWTAFMNKWHCGFLTPVTGPVTNAQLISNHKRNGYFFADPDSGRLVQSPQSSGSW